VEAGGLAYRQVVPFDAGGTLFRHSSLHFDPSQPFAANSAWLACDMARSWLGSQSDLRFVPKESLDRPAAIRVQILQFRGELPSSFALEDFSNGCRGEVPLGLPGGIFSPS
jgi:hypothetical protein